MKILRELLALAEDENKLEIWHSTHLAFSKFKARPTWFAVNKKDATGWHKNGERNHGKQVTYTCEFSGNIASIETTHKVAEKIWPGEEFMYSMFDAEIGEYESKDVKKFIKLLEKEGYEAAYIEDYDPEDFNTGSSKSLVVFNPVKSVKITGIFMGEEPDKSKRSAKPPPSPEEKDKKAAEAAFKYAKKNGPYPAGSEGEAVIAKRPMWSYFYAYEILKKPFPAGEAAIAKSDEYWNAYARNVLHLVPTDTPIGASSEEARAWRKKQLEKPS